MQAAGEPQPVPPQTGGFMDPGLAALIAAILAGGVGGLGYVKDEESPVAKAQKILQKEIDEANTRADEAARNLATASSKEGELADAKKKLAAAEGLVADLQKQLAEREAPPPTETVEDFETAFRNASQAALKAAVPRTLTELAKTYKNVSTDETSNVYKALLYPTSVQGRLKRMSLLDLYSKQFVPAFNKDQGKKGGRGRRRGRKMRGGLGPPPGSPATYGVPSFNEFARVYTGQIRAAMGAAESKLYTDAKEGKAAIDAEIADKPNQAAKKAAMELASKALVLLNDSDKKLSTRKTSEMPESAIEQKKQLYPYVQRHSAVYSLLLKFIPKETWNKIPERGIFGMKKKGGAEDDESESEGESEEEGVEDAGQTGGLSLFKKKEIPPVPEGELKDVPYAWDTVATPQQWEAVKEPVELAMEEYKKAVDAYVAAFDILDKQVPNPFKEASPAEEASAVVPPTPESKGWFSFLKKNAPEKAPGAATSQVIHTGILERTKTMFAEVKKKQADVAAAWNAAKSIHDSACIDGIAKYRWGPETYEKIVALMREGDSTRDSLRRLKEDLEIFQSDYTKATKGIKVIADTSFIKPPDAVEDDIADAEQASQQEAKLAELEEAKTTLSDAVDTGYAGTNALQLQKDLETQMGTKEEREAQKKIRDDRIKALKEKVAVLTAVSRAEKQRSTLQAAEAADTAAREERRRLREERDSKFKAFLDTIKDLPEEEQRARIKQWNTAPPVSEEGALRGGALESFIMLRDRFTRLDTRVTNSVKEIKESFLPRIEKITNKLETIYEKGPMMPADQIKEDAERRVRNEIRAQQGKGPLPLECVPYAPVTPPVVTVEEASKGVKPKSKPSWVWPTNTPSKYPAPLPPKPAPPAFPPPPPPGPPPPAPAITGSTGNPSNLTTPILTGEQGDGAASPGALSQASVRSDAATFGGPAREGGPAERSDAERAIVEAQVTRDPATGRVLPPPRTVGTRTITQSPPETPTGGRHRKTPRKRTLKKRRVGKQNVRGSRHR